jgi:hypothetical protein
VDVVAVAATLARARPVLVLRRILTVVRTLFAGACALGLRCALRHRILMPRVLLRMMRLGVMLLRVLLRVVVALGEPQMRRRGVRATDCEDNQPEHQQHGHETRFQLPSSLGDVRYLLLDASERSKLTCCQNFYRSREPAGALRWPA